MLTIDKVEATLTSDCNCVYFDEEENELPSDECYGCFTDSVDWFNEDVLYPWYAANNYHDNTPIRINATRITWMNRSGYKDTYAKDIVNDLTINGDFTLRFTLEGNKLTCIRSSHDEHGASFEFESRPEEEDYR